MLKIEDLTDLEKANIRIVHTKLSNQRLTLSELYDWYAEALQQALVDHPNIKVRPFIRLQYCWQENDTFEQDYNPWSEKINGNEFSLVTSTQ